MAYYEKFNKYQPVIKWIVKLKIKTIFYNDLFLLKKKLQNDILKTIFFIICY